MKKAEIPDGNIGPDLAGTAPVPAVPGVAAAAPATVAAALRGAAMRPGDLAWFLALAEHGNQQRAADALGVSQSALSKALTRLEAVAGLPLFERSARGLRLTSVGASVRGHAQQVLLALQGLHDALDEQRHSRSGRVRLGTLPYLLPALVSPLLARFFTYRPLATFAVEVQLSARQLALLQDGAIDLALVAWPGGASPPEVDHAPLGPLALSVVARSAHPRRAVLRSLADLGGERWALPAQPLFLRQWLEARFADAGLAPPRVAVESSSSPTAFAELLRRSDLLGLLPPCVLRQAEGQGLAALDGVGLAWTHELAVCWRRGGYLSPLVADFRDAVVDWCREHGV